MPFSPSRLWKQDVALNSYTFSLFLIGLPLTVFGTYVIYQLQVVGYVIGTDIEGQPCVDYCLVPFGKQRLDLNSVLLYLNAMGFGFGGVLALLISAYADFWNNKALLVTLLIIIYGGLSIPVYWLSDKSLAAFRSLMALYVVYAIITYILAVVLNMFIPHCMRLAAEKSLAKQSNQEQAPILNATVAGEGSKSTAYVTTEPTYDIETVVNGAEITVSTPRRYGFKMSIMGGVSTTIGGILALLLVIILAETLPTATGQTAGLLITTIFGFITIAGSVIAYLGLPQVPAKPDRVWKAWWLELFTPFKDLLQRKNMFVLLLSYTIYTDTIFALSSVTSQLYFAEVKPDTLEYSLYSMAGNIFSFVCMFAFYLLQAWRPPFKLETWLIIGYALILVVPLWGCIGLADSVDFGFKNRWEFYVQSFIFYLSGAIVNPVFRVLFSELVPQGSEIEWFGLQVVLSCATSWVSYVANAPLQNATHELRFPIVLCLIFLILPVVLEFMRSTMNVLVKDQLKWQSHVDTVALVDAAAAGSAS